MLTSEFIGSLASSIVGGLVAAFVDPFIARGREFDCKLVHARIEPMIKKVERASNSRYGNDRSETNCRPDELEDASASIVPLGAIEGIETARKFALARVGGTSGSAAELLESLREGLRAELDLQPLEGLRDLFFRMHRDKE